MSTLLRINGRIAWASPDFQVRRKRVPVELDENGELVDFVSAVPPNPKSVRFLPGTNWTSPDSGLVYRVVAHLDPAQGWATTAFWQDRWSLDHRAIVALALAGILEPAIEHGTWVPRYRCCSEEAAKASKPFKLAKSRLSDSRRRARKREEERRKLKLKAKRRGSTA